MNKLSSYIRDIQDFPKPGIVFKDITPLLQDPEGLAHCLHNLCERIGPIKVDKVVGMESRGFLFGPLLAKEYNAGFVPVRKKGKLPYKVVSKNYDLEYGSAALEIHIDAIKKGERVLVHDDVLATGGTAKATCELIEQLGGVVVHCNFIIALEFLNGREQIANYDMSAALYY